MRGKVSKCVAQMLVPNTVMVCTEDLTFTRINQEYPN